MKMQGKAIIAHIVKINNEDTHESHNYSKLMNVLFKMSKKMHNQSKIHIDDFR